MKYFQIASNCCSYMGDDQIIFSSLARLLPKPENEILNIFKIIFFDIILNFLDH